MSDSGREVTDPPKWRQAFHDTRRSIMRLEVCGALSTTDALAILAPLHDRLERAHVDAGLCLGCEDAKDSPMAGYTSLCGCGAKHPHPLPESTA